MGFKVTRCDHKLQDPKNIPLTHLTISSLWVYLRSHGWLAVDVPMASKGKEAIEKWVRLGEGSVVPQQWPRPPGGITGHSGNTAHARSRIPGAQLRLLDSLTPRKARLSPEDVGPECLQVSPQPSSPTQALVPGRCSFRLILSS